MKTNLFNVRSRGPGPKHRRLFARLHKKQTIRELDRQLAKELA